MGWWPFRKKARENASLIRSSGRRGEGIEEDPPTPSSNTPSDEERETVASFPEYEYILHIYISVPLSKIALLKVSEIFTLDVKYVLAHRAIHI